MTTNPPGKPKAHWRRFEQLIQSLFEQCSGVKVKRDAIVKGKSGAKRKLELLVTYPLTVPFSENFGVDLKLKIAVDCKRLVKPVDINDVGAFIDQMDDIGAHAGIMVATGGFGKGAAGRAKARSVFLIDTPTDLLLLAEGLEVEEFFQCRCCNHGGEDDDHMPGVVDWRSRKVKDHGPAWGECDRCTAPHAMCSDCGEMLGVLEAEYRTWLECPGGCGRLYKCGYNARDMETSTQTIGPMSRRVLIEAAKRKGSLPYRQYTGLLKGTKWQYARGKADPLWWLHANGYIESRGKRDAVVLTDEGTELANDELPSAVDSMYWW